MSTAVLVARELKYPSANIVVKPGIYQADVDTLLAIIRALPDKAPAVLLTGHNPTITDVANYLSPSPLSGEMPTAAVICLHFPNGKLGRCLAPERRVLLLRLPQKQLARLPLFVKLTVKLSVGSCQV